MNGAQKVYIKSFGCQMNVYDSNRMADTLAPEGFAETATPDDAVVAITIPTSVSNADTTGVMRGVGSGSTSVIATSEGKSDTAIITVGTITLATVSVGASRAGLAGEALLPRAWSPQRWSG